MVSIEQIKRANHLSKELKKHGFASDMSEAYKQAEQIFDRSKKSPEVGFPDGTVLIQETSYDEEIQALASQVKGLERYRSFAQNRESEFKEQLSQVTSKLNELIKLVQLTEMNQQSFQKQLDELKHAPVVQAPVKAPEAPEPVAPAAPATSQPTRNQTSPDSKYTPEDVAIDKIFYYGNK